ncbi:glycosyltransferase family 39 protein [Candidatus Gottesmanbacteria bacterium]|nr:glycosyltransferase family 39 protein [Candidatus Gottesmanbacteria bacterium]
MLDFIFYHTPIFYLIQSVWRDEAFSYFMAKPNLIQVIINTANDFNPPLYYSVLHVWMQIAGKSDEWLRLLSLFPHLLTVYFAYKLAAKLFNNKFAYFTALFTLFNPMLVYYAFEMRMYSFYALFTLCSLYFFYTKNWRWYIVVTVLGLYTHSFFPLIIFSYIFYLFLTKQFDFKSVFRVLTPLLFYLPWLPILIIQFLHSGNSWMFPVDIQLINSVLGNLFTSYEGTPGEMWKYTAILSGIIVIFFILGAKYHKKKALLFLTPIFLPLVIILGYSILRRPIYVNRYLIFVTVFEIMAISLGIWSIKNKTLQSVFAILWLIFVIALNLIIPPYHKKTDFKTAFAEINKKALQDDFVYSKTPIGFLESAYYFRNINNIFVYNPNNVSIPNYIGVNVVFPNTSKSSFPFLPAKTFLVNDDASFELIIIR